MLPPRKIIHLDMDAFYASVEQRDDPALRGRPVAVGGSQERGVVAAASYEARAFGVRSAMPAAQARRRCPALVFVPPRFAVYKEVSGQIRAIFARYTDLIEPVSLDEAYLDVTENRAGLASATAVAREIRAAIRAETGLSASAGISYNKFLAKLASDFNKPDGQHLIRPHEGPAFVAGLEIGQFHGIGPATAARMQALGIFTGLDLRQQPEALLVQHFGKAGRHYHAIARAEDARPVRPNRVRKSIGSETTFAHNLHAPAALLAALVPLAASVWATAQRHGTPARTLTLKVRFADFRLLTRSRSLAQPLADQPTLERLAAELLTALLPLPQPVRLLGLSLSNLGESAGGQLALGL